MDTEKRGVAIPTGIFEVMSDFREIRLTPIGGTQGIIVPEEAQLRKLLDSGKVNFNDFDVVLSPKL